jgi:hypothetical protein
MKIHRHRTVEGICDLFGINCFAPVADVDRCNRYCACGAVSSYVFDLAAGDPHRAAKPRATKAMDVLLVVDPIFMCCECILYRYGGIDLDVGA